jgi:iron complex outermembrane receptor protein
VTYQVAAGQTLYAALGRGFKAGGFNPASPAGSESYDEESTWNVEGGTKTTFAGGKATATATAFWTNWDDLQLNLPNPSVPGQFYIANVGAAETSGIELAMTGQAAR